MITIRDVLGLVPAIGEAPVAGPPVLSTDQQPM